MRDDDGGMGGMGNGLDAGERIDRIGRLDRLDQAQSHPPAPPPDDGWRPADHDQSPRAVAWRAKTALRRADRALSGQNDLRVAIDRLNRTICQAEARASRAWGIASRLLWALGVPLLLAAISGLGAVAWRAVSAGR